MGYEIEDISTAEEIAAAKVIVFPGVGIFGQVDVPPGIARRMGLAAALPIGRTVRPLAEAMAATADDLAAAGADVAGMWAATHG